MTSMTKKLRSRDSQIRRTSRLYVTYGLTSLYYSCLNPVRSWLLGYSALAIYGIHNFIRVGLISFNPRRKKMLIESFAELGLYTSTSLIGLRLCFRQNIRSVTSGFIGLTQRFGEYLKAVTRRGHIQHQVFFQTRWPSNQRQRTHTQGQSQRLMAGEDSQGFHRQILGFFNIWFPINERT